ncbi:MAG: nitronate monooxygenase [Rhizobiaceae bacterium]|nr:nitronate monooxygenase [Rhizobiaceae bacterium]
MSDVARELFANLRLPLVAAPMFLVTGPTLVIEACKAGIVGVATASWSRSPEQYDEWLDEIQTELAAWTRATGQKPGPLVANLGARPAPPGETPRWVRDLEILQRRGVRLVITVNGLPDEIVKHVHAWGGAVFHDVTTLKHARKALEAGVDGLVAIAGGGGGHAGYVNPFAFVPALRRLTDKPIILGGAIANGAGVAAARLLGADLCYMGTRFIATRESSAPEAYKRMLVAATAADIVYTPAFNRINVNLLKPSIVENGFDLEALTYEQAQQNPNFATRRLWRDIWAAGHGVELIDDIPSVAELVDAIEREYGAANDRHLAALGP